MITLAELYRHAADNIEAGRPEAHGLEYLNLRGDWVKTQLSDLIEIMRSIAGDTKYRIAPKTIRIGDIDVPAPVTKPLEIGQKYYVVNPSAILKCVQYVWKNDEYEMLMLERRMIHLTLQAAGAHVMALIIISGGKVG